MTRALVNPPVLLVVCIFAGGMLQLYRPLEIAPYPFMAGLAAGVAFFVAAVALGATAIRQMKAHGTGLEPGGVPRRLVTTGPFRFSRNPLYLAQLLTLLGIALAMNSTWFVAATILQLVLLDRLIVVREERVIRSTFGAEYDAYTARVRRWL
jgi:protein-S-isoprenylcysteine O-methyltransferase Ste14